MKSRINKMVQGTFPMQPPKNIAFDKLLKIKFNKNPPQDSANEIVKFIRRSVLKLNNIGLRNIVVGVSGGIDSMLAVYLAKLALIKSKANLLAVYVDLGREIDEIVKEELIEDLNSLDIKYEIIKAHSLPKILRDYGTEGPFTQINIDRRIINDLIFQRADIMNAVVISTMNKNEHLLGTTTELFSGHIAPLKHLYKSEVIEIAKEVGLGKTNALKARTGCADYWYDDEIFGVSNQVIGSLLYLFYEKGYSSDKISKEFSIPNSRWLKKFEKRVRFQRYRLDTQSLRPEHFNK